jgi:AcrR family transcriptional regulator
MTPDPQARRERRAAQRRSHILEAAASVFAERGFHRTTTRDIAEAADIAEGTIYNYFQSKEDILLSIIQRLANLEGRREVMEHALQEDFRAFFARHMLERLARANESWTLFAAVLPELISTPTLRDQYNETLIKPGIEILEQHFQARRDVGEMPPIDVADAVRLASAVLVGIMFMVMLDDEGAKHMWAEPDTLAELLTVFIFGGMEAMAANPPDPATS